MKDEPIIPNTRHRRSDASMSPGKVRKPLEMQMYAMLQADRMQMQMPSIEGQRRTTKRHVNHSLHRWRKKKTNETKSCKKRIDGKIRIKQPTQQKLSHKFDISTISTPTLHLAYHTHSHSQNTHHRATRSARTRPRQVPRSPILMTVSHTLPSAGASVTEHPFGSGELII